jgi:hypothetical protein
MTGAAGRLGDGCLAALRVGRRRRRRMRRRMRRRSYEQLRTVFSVKKG